MLTKFIFRSMPNQNMNGYKNHREVKEGGRMLADSLIEGYFNPNHPNPSTQQEIIDLVNKPEYLDPTHEANFWLIHRIANIYLGSSKLEWDDQLECFWISHGGYNYALHYHPETPNPREPITIERLAIPGAIGATLRFLHQITPKNGISFGQSDSLQFARETETLSPYYGRIIASFDPESLERLAVISRIEECVNQIPQQVTNRLNHILRNPRDLEPEV